MKEVKLYLNYAGFCYSRESHAIRGGRKIPIKFYALFGLIQHPEKGWILYDTGYTRRFYEATAHFPNRLYALATDVHVTDRDAVKSQLERFGINASEIQHIIITHFHADHIGGLRDFDHANIYCSSAAYAQLLNLNPYFGFTKGILKTLLPDDLDRRVKLIDENCQPVDDDIFGKKYDLFGDQSILIYALPGHAAGQIGVEITTKRQSYFLIADACWLKQSYEKLILPNPIVRLFFDSWKDFRRSLVLVNRFYLTRPETLIVPTHCGETTGKLVSQKISMDEL